MPSWRSALRFVLGVSKVGGLGLVEGDARKGDLQRRIVRLYATAYVCQCVFVVALDLLGLLAWLQVGQLFVNLGNKLRKERN